MIIEYFQQFPTSYLFFVGLLSLLVGSFLNVVIYRLPIMMERDWKSQCLELLADDKSCQCKQTDDSDEKFNLNVPRSTCPKCGHKITAIENIPLLSYFLLLKGKCSDCKAHISLRYPIIELTTAILSVLVAWQFGVTWQAVAGIVLTWALISLTMIDFDKMLLPDDITLPFLWLGLLLSLFGVFTDLQSSVIGAMVGYLSLWTVYQSFKLLTGKEGMGYGDFKLLAVFGAWFGWQPILLIIILSSLVGAIVGISLMLFLGRDKNIPIPFGPYLAAAGWITMMVGDDLMDFYISVSGIV